MTLDDRTHGHQRRVRRLTSTCKFDLFTKPGEEFQRLHGVIDFIPQVVRSTAEGIERGEIIPDIGGDQTTQNRKILFVPIGKLMTPGHGFGWIQLNLAFGPVEGEIVMNAGMWHKMEKRTINGLNRDLSVPPLRFAQRKGRIRGQGISVALKDCNPPFP